MPVVVYGMSGFTAPNHCMLRYEVNVGFGCVRWNVIVSPLAVMRAMCCVLQARKSSPPKMTFWNWSLTPYGEPIFGLRFRSQARWYEAAVTGEPSLNLRPGRMCNVYVFPSLETVGNDVAASGYSSLPACPFFSGKFTSSICVA